MLVYLLDKHVFCWTKSILLDKITNLFVGQILLFNFVGQICYLLDKYLFFAFVLILFCWTNLFNILLFVGQITNFVQIFVGQMFVGQILFCYFVDDRTTMMRQERRIGPCQPGGKSNNATGGELHTADPLPPPPP